MSNVKKKNACMRCKKRRYRKSVTIGKTFNVTRLCLGCYKELTN